MLLSFHLTPDYVTRGETKETLDLKDNKVVHKSDTATDDLHVETEVKEGVKADENLNHKHVTDKETNVYYQTEVKEFVEAPIYNTEKSKYLLLYCL